MHVAKGNAVVLIHHTQPDIRPFNNVDEATAFVWNAIVAPRYTNVAKLWVRRSWYTDGGAFGARHFAEGDLTEKATGKRVHVALYRGGNGARWLEFVTPDRDAFQKQFAMVYDAPCQVLRHGRWGHFAAHRFFVGGENPSFQNSPGRKSGSGLCWRATRQEYPVGDSFR